jgi:hypothetical protein
MRYNNTLARLRHVFDVAKDAGIIYTNPAETLGAGAGARTETARCQTLTSSCDLSAQ